METWDDDTHARHISMDGKCPIRFQAILIDTWNRRAPIEGERRYMGQIMAECDCSREAACEEAQRCLASTGPDFLEEMQR
jgi:hypothetical protein